MLYYCSKIESFICNVWVYNPENKINEKHGPRKHARIQKADNKNSKKIMKVLNK